MRIRLQNVRSETSTASPESRARKPRWWTLLIAPLVMVFFPLLAAGQKAPVMTTVVVPVVGTVDGANGFRWKTDVTLYNDQQAEATVALELPTAPDQPAMITTVPGGQNVNFTDVVASFGLESALSPLVVRTAGRRSVRIAATVYGVRGTDVTTPQPISVEYLHSSDPQRLLAGLSFSDQYRTNVGIVNLGEKEATFTLALQRVAGRNLAMTHFTMPPNSNWHASIQSLFPLITSGSDFSIVVETSAPNTYVYASVIENETNVARFVQPGISALQIEQASADR